MTNINCSSNCIYQEDGKCSLDNVCSKIITPQKKCVYYIEKRNEKNKE